MENRFNIDFFLFSVLVENCIPPRPIARAFFWDEVINTYYNVLTQDERNNLYGWINRNPYFEHQIKDKQEDCLLFNARYDKENQYIITINYEGEIKNVETFRWEEKYHISKSTSLQEEYIINIKQLNA